MPRDIDEPESDDPLESGRDDARTGIEGTVFEATTSGLGGALKNANSRYLQVSDETTMCHTVVALAEVEVIIALPKWVAWVPCGALKRTRAPVHATTPRGQ